MVTKSANNEKEAKRGDQNISDESISPLQKNNQLSQVLNA